MPDTNVKPFASLPDLACHLTIHDIRGFSLTRTDTGDEVAFVHDDDHESDEPEAYARLLSLAPVMSRLLAEALNAWAEQFDDLDPTDPTVPGADLVEWFADWRLRVRQDMIGWTRRPAPDEPEEAPATLFWVAVYLADRAYGGPEEGGWYFECGELVTDPDIYRDLGALPAAFLTRAEAVRHASRMERKLDTLNAGRPSKDSSISQGVYEVHVHETDSLPSHFPAQVPRYE